jgi:glycosyltransferase involved in cell wall biosynthesis
MEQAKKFIVLHDAIPIKYNINIEWYNNIIENLDKSIWCFFPSRNTLNDILATIPERIDEQKMAAVHIAAGLQFIPKYDKNVLQSTLQKYNIRYKSEDNYIFSLCTIEPRKNLLFTIACFIKFIEKHNIRNLYFYLGGGHFDDFITEFDNKFEEFAGYRDRIIRLGYIDDEDINILYSNSMFFTYLSRYEGFGMPPLEAMQAGTPVITSNNSSIPEVVGDAAVMIDCDSEEQCIKAFEDFYFNEDLRRHYIQKGLERGKLFTWEKTADIMEDIMLKSLNSIIEKEK